MEATFLGLELDIVARRRVGDPPPPEYLIPRLRRITAEMIEEAERGWAEPGFDVDRYWYVGMGIYRRVA